MDWNLKKEMVPRENGTRCVSPWALIWREENYYLAAYDSVDGIIKHYRVDKMGGVALTDKRRDGKDKFADIDLARYSNSTFGMYGGREETVTLSFPNRLIGVVMDRFGKDADIRPLENGEFRVRARIFVSGQFFGWLSGIGGEAHIVSPGYVRSDYMNWLAGILKGMENE